MVGHGVLCRACGGTTHTWAAASQLASKTSKHLLGKGARHLRACALPVGRVARLSGSRVAEGEDEGEGLCAYTQTR